MKQIIVCTAEFDTEADQNRFLAYFIERVERIYDPAPIPEGLRCGVYVRMDGRPQDRFVAQLDVLEGCKGTAGQLFDVLRAWEEEQQRAREGTEIFHRVPFNVAVD